MAKLTSHPTITVEVKLTLTEIEARALDGLTGYSMDGFLDFFYKNMGRHYLEPHEAGLRSLFKTIRGTIPPIMDRVDKARLVFEAKGDG